MIEKKLTYKFDVSAASAPLIHEYSYELNRALNDEFRIKFHTRNKNFSEVLRDLCLLHNLKNNKHSIFIVVYDRHLFTKNDGYGRLGDNYYFETRPLMRQSPYFEYSKLIDIEKTLLTFNSYGALITYLSELSCLVLKELAIAEGWNLGAVDLIRRDILAFVSGDAPHRTR